MALSLVIITALAYVLGVSIDFVNMWTLPGERLQKLKLIPAEIVLLTIPINIGQWMDPASAFRLFTNTSKRDFSLVWLVLVSIIVYIFLLSIGKWLHNRNRGEAFCKTGTDKIFLIILYTIAGIFMVSTVVIATY